MGIGTPRSSWSPSATACARSRSPGCEWSQVEFSRNAALHVRRVKNGTPSVHPLQGDELRALRELQRQFPDSGYVFASERGGPLTTDAINLLVKTIGKRSGLPFSVHVHMLRHACGYALANAGHDTRRIQSWLGHRSDPEHRALHGAVVCALQGVLAGIMIELTTYRWRDGTQIAAACFENEPGAVRPLALSAADLAVVDAEIAALRLAALRIKHGGSI